MDKSLLRRIEALQKLAAGRPAWVTFTLDSGLKIQTSKESAAILEAVMRPVPDRRIEDFE